MAEDEIEKIMDVVLALYGFQGEAANNQLSFSEDELIYVIDKAEGECRSRIYRLDRAVVCPAHKACPERTWGIRAPSSYYGGGDMGVARSNPE